MSEKILIKLPSRSRPANLFRALDNITSLIQLDNYEILCSFDVDDKLMVTDEIKDRLSLYPKVLAVWGTSKNKIQAVNADIWMIEDWDILVSCFS